MTTSQESGSSEGLVVLTRFVHPPPFLHSLLLTCSGPSSSCSGREATESSSDLDDVGEHDFGQNDRYGEEEEVKKDLLVEHVVKETTEMKVGQDGTKLCSLTEKIQSSGDFFSDNQYFVLFSLLVYLYRLCSGNFIFAYAIQIV